MTERREVPKIHDWKQQFFEVKKIGPEPGMTRPPWKVYRPKEIKDSGNQEPDRTTA